MKNIHVRATIALALLASVSCDTQKELFSPESSRQNSMAGPMCYGREATIFEGNPGGGSMVPNGSGGFTITGTTGNDVIVGSANADEIDGLGGTDRICAGDGDDVIVGGAGYTLIDGEAGIDEVDYSASSAGVSIDLHRGRGTGGDAEDDRIHNIENATGSAFDDVLNGSPLANLLTGGAGNDVLRGEDGADVLSGGAGTDELYGGAGADVIDGGDDDDAIAPGADADDVDGGNGTDLVNYISSSAGVTVDLGAGTGLGGDAEGDTFAGIENVTGTNLVDALTGDGFANTLDGRGGDDVINGGGGNDRLVGGAGEDTLHGNADDDLLLGNDDNDDLHGDAGNDRIFGHDGDDTLAGGDDNDDLRPGAGANIVDGGAGTDHLDTTACTDSVTNVETFKTVRCAIAADATTSTIETAHATLTADGVASTTITVQLKDASGANLTFGGPEVVVTTDAGLLTDGVTQSTSMTAIDQGDGTYTLTLTASAALETATLTAAVDAAPFSDDAAVQFVAGAVDHFVVTGTDGNAISEQASGVAFDIMIVAQDANNHTAEGFTGTVTLTANPGALALGTSAAFTAGVLASQTVTITGGADFTITASDGTHVGSSESFTVTSNPGAVANEVSGTSAPDDSYHSQLNTAVAVIDGTDDLLANDNLGFPAATVTHFGAVQCNDGTGTLNAAADAVTANAAGATADLSGLTGCGAGSTLVVNADGTLTFTPSATYTGLVRFQYRIGNAGGTSDAQVTLAVGVRPTAANSTYDPAVRGNVPINTATSTGTVVTATGDVPTFNITGTTGGAAVVATNKTYTFTPAAGYTGGANFTFTVTNGFGTSSAGTVSLDVGTPVWFVDAAAGAGGDGTMTAPFNCLVGASGCFNGSANEAGDVIHVAAGTYSNTGALVLKDTQKLIGEGAAGTFAAASGFVTWPADAGAQPATAGTAPALQSASGNVITLGSNNMIRGADLTTGTGGASLFGNNFGTVTVSELSINSTGQAIDLTTGTISGSFAQVSSTGGARNIALTGVATLSATVLGTAANAVSGATGDAVLISGQNGSFTYPGSITNTTSLAVNVNNKTGGTVVFSGSINPAAAGRGISVVGNGTGTNTITFSGTAKKVATTSQFGVFVNNNDGATVSFTGGGMEVSTTVLAGFAAQNTSTVIVTGSGNTVSTTGTATNAVFLSTIGVGAGGLNFASINAGSATTAAGVAMSSVSGAESVNLGNVTVSGGVTGLQLLTTSAPITATPTINGVSNIGVFISSNTAPITLSAGAIGNTNDPDGVAVNIVGGSADVTIATPITKASGNRLVNIINRTGGTVDFQGNVGCTASCTGVNVTSNTGGTVQFSGTTKTLNTPGTQPVTFSGNTGGSTLAFTNGGLAVTSGTAAGIFASNTAPANATLKVQGSNNTISSTTGTALNVSSTTIGAPAIGEGGLNFRSISSNGGVNGIVLNGVGGTNGLTVTGTGGDDTGGTISNSSSDAILLNNIGPVILNQMSLSSNGGSHIDATNVNGLTLTSLETDLSTDHGIVGTNITGFNVTASTFDRGGAGSGSSGKHGVFITNLLGTSSVTTTLFKRSNTIQFFVTNTAATVAAPAASQDILTLSGNTWNEHTGIFGGDHFSLLAAVNSNMRLIVNAASGENKTGGLLPVGSNEGGNAYNVQATAGGKVESSITGVDAMNVTSGVNVAASTGGINVYDVFGNKTANGTGFASHGIMALNLACINSTCSGKFRDNTISHTAPANVNAINVVQEGSGINTVRVEGNVVSGTFQHGIKVHARHGNGTSNVTVNNNTLTQTSNLGLDVINVEAGASGGGQASTICLNMHNNNATMAPGGTNAYRIRTWTSTVMNLQDFAGSGASSGDLQNWVTTTKSNSGLPVNPQNSGGTFQAASGNCPTP